MHDLLSQLQASGLATGEWGHIDGLAVVADLGATGKAQADRERRLAGQLEVIPLRLIALNSTLPLPSDTWVQQSAVNWIATLALPAATAAAGSAAVAGTLATGAAGVNGATGAAGGVDATAWAGACCT